MCKRIPCTTFLLLFFLQQNFAQSKPELLNKFYTYKNEVGVNTTALLGNLLSLSNIEDSPYGFMYARHKNKYTLRLGFNIFTTSKNSFDTIGTRVLRDQNHGVRFCYERNYQLNNRFMMHGGFDVIGKYNSSYSTIGNFFSNSIQNISGGGGPAMRIVFKLHERIYLMTESTLYAEYGQKLQTTVLNKVKSKNTNDFYSFKLTMPTNLFVSIHF
jgi:hypothetical protein